MSTRLMAYNSKVEYWMDDEGLIFTNQPQMKNSSYPQVKYWGTFDGFWFAMFTIGKFYDDKMKSTKYMQDIIDDE